jgi:signal transduction histidine kinase/DNA-binding response OmpR family regulator/ligand-binding sensor domain-containing protein
LEFLVDFLSLIDLNMYRLFRSIKPSLQYVVVVFFFMNGSNLFGQYYNMKCTNIGIPEGLSNNHITDILQDEYDYIWIATEKGLNRTDGSKVVNIPLPEDSIHPAIDNHVIDLEINVEGGLWILTEKDLFTYKNGRFQKTVISDRSDFKIKGIVEAENSNWFITNNGVFQYDQLSHSFYQYEIAQNTDFKYSFINDTDIQAILMNKENKELWVATGNKGVYVKNIETNVVKPYFLRPNEGRNRNNIFINKMLCDSYGTIWFASPEGLWGKFADSQNCRLVELPKTGLPNEVMSIELDNEDNLWCAVSDLGLLVLDRNGEIIEHFDAEDQNESGFASRYISNILLDRHSNIWVGHQEFGVDFFAADYSRIISYYKNVKDESGYLPTPVKRIFPLENQDILVVYESSDNPIVSGLSILSTEFGTFKSRPAQVKQLKLNQDDLDVTEVFNLGNQFVVSTYNSNYSFDMGELYRDMNPIQILPKTTTYADYVMFHYLHEDKYYILGEHLRTFNLSTGEDNLFISDLNLDRFVIDKHGLLWGAASNSGLVIFNVEENNSLAQFSHDPLDDKTLSDNVINCIYKDSNGDFWFGTEFGLNKLEQNIDSILYSSTSSNWEGLMKDLSFKRFKTDDGLTNNSIKSILEDDQKRLWLATNEGISVLDLTNHKICKLGKWEGIQEGEFLLNSCAKSTNGTLYFGGKNGLNFIDPSNVDFQSKQFNLFINELNINNQKISVGSEIKDRILLETDLEKTEAIELEYQDKLLQIGFVAVDYKHSDAIQYYYMLDGFDIDWIKASEGNKANYTKLPAGEYTFRVKAQTIDNHWTEEARLELVISPPFWASWWFISLVSIMLIGVIIFYIRYRLRHLRYQKQKLEEIVHSRTEDLEDANAELEEQKNEILKQRDQLYALNQKIKEVNALKLRFFTNVSHELRTPLTLILAPLEKLIKTEGISKLAQEKHALIQRNALRLQELINQLLQFRKIETGNQLLLGRKGDIISFLSALAEKFRSYAEEAGLQFKFITEKEVCETWFDEDKLDKIISNLLANACKFTPEGGKICMEIDCTPNKADNYIKINVRDTGIGISQEDKERIFDRFYENEEAISRVQGTGIGLALTRSLVELHKGKISVESQVGKGSCFTVELPLGRDYLEECEISEDQQQPCEYAPDGFETLSQSNRNYTPANHEQDGDRKTILIVEDNQDLRNFLKDLLSEEYNVETANNGKDALDIIHSDDHISLIVSDIRMPVMDGLSFCKRIKDDVETSHLPVLLLTAKQGEESEIEGLKTGADDYITKPFSEEILKTKLRNIFRYREQVRIKFSNGVSLEPSEITTTSRDEEFIKKAIEVVEAHISDPDFDIVSFASAMAVSPSTLLRKFKAIIGESSEKFIRTIRLKRAAQLLQKSQFTVTEICYDVGFSSQKHFSTTFKKQFELTPSEYRKKYNEVENTIDLNP